MSKHMMDRTTKKEKGEKKKVLSHTQLTSVQSNAQYAYDILNRKAALSTHIRKFTDNFFIQFFRKLAPSSTKIKKKKKSSARPF